MSQQETGAQSGAAPGRVSTLELFFDLVFVFTLTQLTVRLEHELSFEVVGQVVLVFVILFWMHGGYAWLTNQIAPHRIDRRLLMIAAMVAFMVCALAVPGAFDGSGLAFGIGYLLVVVVHAGLYVQTAGVGVLRFVPLNIVGALALVAAGFIDGPGRYLLWLAPLALQYLTTVVVQRMTDPASGPGFELRSTHFVERHGLLLIVALGESVVAVGIGLGEVELDTGNYLAAALGLALAAGLWWVYFTGDDERAEAALAAAEIRERLAMALKGYFYSFIPMLLGVIVVAAGTVHAIAHTNERLDWSHASLLAAGTALYLAGNVAFRSVMRLRPVIYRAMGAVAAMASAVVGWSVSALAQLVFVVAACRDARGRTPLRPAGRYWPHR